jgi:hypothetical protein
MRYLRQLFVVALTAVLSAALIAQPAGAGHNEDEHSDNVRLLAEKAIIIEPDDPETPDTNEEVRAAGSDLAFQKDLLVAGSYEGVGFFKLRKQAPYLEQIGYFPCPGSQGDVSVWGELVFVSVDAPRDKPECDSVGANQAQTAQGADWEGVRILDISNIKQVKQIAAIDTDCGSHTHTLVPAGKKLYVYVESYPLTGQSDSCNAVSHRKISVIEVPLAKPAKAKVVTTPSLLSTIGCHDITVDVARKLAVGACVSESQVWDVSKPTEPVLLARIHNPRIQIHHSTGFTWDGKYLVLGDEFGGAAAGGCVGNSQVPMGAMWFYDITDPENPQEAGYWAPPRVFTPPDDTEEAQRPRCTTHNFNVLPMKDDRYIAVSSYYSVALSVIEFTDPSSPSELGYYLPKESGKNPDTWSAYWYNGLIYSNDHASKAGIRVFEMDGLSTKEVKTFKTRFNPQTQML